MPGGVKLHSVYNDRVILDRNGSLESLPLPRQNNGTHAGCAAHRGGAAHARTPLPSVCASWSPASPASSRTSCGPSPCSPKASSAATGFTPDANRQAFVRLGLRPGDLVTAINGTPLDDPARGQEIFATIGTSSEAHVTVMRNGQAEDVTLNMAQVAQDAEQLTGAGGDAPPASEGQVPQDPPLPQQGGPRSED